MALFPYVVGRGQRFYVTSESTQNTFAKASSGDAVKVLKTSFQRKQERKDRADARLTRSTIERITGNTTVNVSIEAYLNPSGTAGTPPDMHLLLLSHFGSYANVGSTSDTYSESDLQTAIASLSLTREFNAGTATTGIMSQAVSGFTPNVMKLAIKGGEEPRVTFEGEAFEMVNTTYTTTFAEIASGATQVTVVEGAAANTVTDNASVFRIGSVVAFGTSAAGTNAGSGYMITGITGTVWDFSPAATGTITAGVDVLPYVPAETTTGSPIAGILGSLSFDAVNRPGPAGSPNTALPIVECTIERTNNIKYFHDVAFQPRMVDYVPGFTECKVGFTLRARRDHCVWLAEHQSAIATQYPVIITCGSSAGRRMVVTMNRVEFEDVDLDTPDGDEVALIKLQGKAMGNTGADAITLAFT